MFHPVEIDNKPPLEGDDTPISGRCLRAGGKRDVLTIGPSDYINQFFFALRLYNSIGSGVAYDGLDKTR